MRSFLYIGLVIFLVAIIIFIVISQLNNKNRPINSKTVTDVTKQTSISNTQLPFKRLEVEGKDAITTIERLKSEKLSIITPVLLRGEEQLRMLTDVIDYNELSPENILTRALEINVDDFFKNVLRKIQKY